MKVRKMCCVMNGMKAGIYQAMFLVFVLVATSVLCLASEEAGDIGWKEAGSLPACEEELGEAVKKCDAGWIREHVADNLEINCSVSDRESLLHVAAYNGCEEAAEMLLEAGADFRVVDEYGITPLGYSAIEGNWGVEKILLAHGAEIYTRDEPLYPDNPLHLAVFRNDIDGVEKLMAAGADVDKRLLEHEEENVLYGFDMVLGTADQHMPIHAAAYYCRKEITGILVENGADIDAYSYRDGSGYTPLHVSLYRKCPEVADILINAGADSSLVYHDVTPSLFSLQPDMTPVCIAAKMKLFVTASKLIKKYFDPLMECRGEFLDDVVLNNKPDLIEQYLNRGGALAIKGWGYNPFFAAVLTNNIEIVKLIIDEGVDVNSDIDVLFSAAKKPIHVVFGHQFQEESFPILRILLENGADPNIRDAMGKTPLQNAMELDCLYREKAMKLLLSYGATISKDGVPYEEMSRKDILEHGMKSCISK